MPMAGMRQSTINGLCGTFPRQADMARPNGGQLGLARAGHVRTSSNTRPGVVLWIPIVRQLPAPRNSYIAVLPCPLTCCCMAISPCKTRFPWRNHASERSDHSRVCVSGHPSRHVVHFPPPLPQGGRGTKVRSMDIWALSTPTDYIPATHL